MPEGPLLLSRPCGRRRQLFTHCFKIESKESLSESQINTQQKQKGHAFLFQDAADLHSNLCAVVLPFKTS